MGEFSRSRPSGTRPAARSSSITAPRDRPPCSKMFAPLADGGQPLPRHDVARRLRTVDAPRGSRRRVGRAPTPGRVLDAARSRRSLRRRRLVGRRTARTRLRGARRAAVSSRRGRSRASCPRTSTSTGPRGWDPRTSRSSRSRKRVGRSTKRTWRCIGDAFADATQDNVVELFGGLLSDPDKAAFDSDERPRAFRRRPCAKVSRTGWRGFYDDDQAMMKEWGFDPTTIAVPVAVWFGDHDLMVPRTHGEWLARRPADGEPTLTSQAKGTCRLSPITSTSSRWASRRFMRSSGVKVSAVSRGDSCE